MKLLSDNQVWSRLQDKWIDSSEWNDAEEQSKIEGELEMERLYASVNRHPKTLAEPK